MTTDRTPKKEENFFDLLNKASTSRSVLKYSEKKQSSDVITADLDRIVTQIIQQGSNKTIVDFETSFSKYAEQREITMGQLNAWLEVIQYATTQKFSKIVDYTTMMGFRTFLRQFIQTKLARERISGAIDTGTTLGEASIKVKSQLATDEKLAQKQIDAYLKKCAAAIKENEKIIVNHIKKSKLNASGKELIAGVAQMERGGDHIVRSGFLKSVTITGVKKDAEPYLYPDPTNAMISATGPRYSGRTDINALEPALQEALVYQVELMKFQQLLKNKEKPATQKLHDLNRNAYFNADVLLKQAFISMDGGAVTSEEYLTISNLLREEVARLKGLYTDNANATPKAKAVAQIRLVAIQDQLKVVAQKNSAGLLSRDFLVKILSQLKGEMKTTRFFASTGARKFAELITALKHPKVQKTAKSKFTPEFWSTFSHVKNPKVYNSEIELKEIPEHPAVTEARKSSFLERKRK